MNFIQTGYKGKNDWWMYVLMFLIVIIGAVIGQIPLTIVAWLKADGNQSRFLESANNNFADLGINSSYYLFLILLSFVVPLILFVIALKGMHKKKLTWIVTSREKIDWKRVGFGVIFWGIISVVIIGFGILISPEKFVWNFKPIPFLLLLLVSVLFIPLQTTLEELLFRGYYFQGIGMMSKNKWIPLLVMGCVFGLLHGANPEIEKLGYIALVFYIGTGIFFGLVTLLDEGAELAIGMHAINNVVAAIFVTTNWTVFQTDALFVDISEPSVTLEMFLPVFVVYPIMILILSKKYGWKNWKNKLFGAVESPIIDK